MSNLKSPLISIIIPIYNVEQYIYDAINSIINQTYKRLEIILVDDGSTDNSSKLCDKIAKTDERIIVIHKNNGGLSSARNIGLNKTNGDYIYFLDGDDFVENNTIELLYKKIANKSNIGIVSAPCFYSYNKGNTCIFNERWNIQTERIISYDEFCIATLQQTSCHSACSKLYRKELFKNIRFREGKKNEDTLFMFDLSSVMQEYKYNMLEVPAKLYYYRVNNDSISRNTRCPIQIDIVENLNTLIKENKNLQIQKVLKRLFYNELLSFMSMLLINKQMKENIQYNDLKRFEKIVGNVRILDVLKFSSIKNVIRYILFKYIPSIYINTKSLCLIM